jgi:predicted Zn finger-like uncharacterized protein
VAEAIHCPSCTTRYRLRPERLKPVHRRAKCFSCGGIFPVGDIVQRLLALPSQEATAAFEMEAVEAAQHAEMEPAEAPPLTLHDLDVADAELLEQTLVTVPESLPEAKAQAPAFLPPEITETTLSGYTSARDAIEKLFGSAPAASTGLKVNQEPSSMDMEATLSALETTLGASQSTPPPAAGPLGDSTTASGLTEEDLNGPSSSTMRLTQEDLQAILASAPPPAPEPTVAIRAADLVAAKELGSPAPSAPRSFVPLLESPDTGAELLRLKIGEDIYGGLTMPQLIAWVEEGRILENHLVARQHSENWLEAHKVPGLRPVFERLRRERSGGAPSLDLGLGEIAPKRSLFGGLFGKN